MSAFESRQDIYHWQNKLRFMLNDLESLLMIVSDETNITAAEHNELCKAITHLETFKESFDELEDRLAQYYYSQDND